METKIHLKIKENHIDIKLKSFKALKIMKIQRYQITEEYKRKEIE